MRAASWLKLLCLAAALYCGVVAAAQAVDSTPPQSDPAAPLTAPDHPLPATPAPVAASDLQSCLQETGNYVRRGSSSVIYVIRIANTCDKRLRCEIFASVTGAKGSSRGHTIMTLGPASAGKAAKKSYGMGVEAAGGIVQVSRECKVL